MRGEAEGPEAARPEWARSARVDVLRGREALSGLEQEWAALWERCPELTAFQHPAWLLPWSRHFGGDEFLTCTLRQAGRLAGLAPFFSIADTDVDVGADADANADADGGRALLLLGTGNTDYLDLLVEPALGAEGAAALLGAALAAAACDRCELRQLRPGSPLLEAAAPPGWRTELLDDEPCPVLSLPTSPAALERHIPPHHLRRVRRDRRRLERHGEVSWTVATAANFAEVFDSLVRIHQARWSEQGEPGSFRDDAALAFHREAALSLLRQGWLRLFALRLAGQLIGIYYTFNCRGRAHIYLTGYDEAYANLSPGTLTLAHAVEAAVREGARHFDFLRGRESYKYLWGASDAPTYRRRLWRSEAEHGS